MNKNKKNKNKNFSIEHNPLKYYKYRNKTYSYGYLNEQQKTPQQQIRLPRRHTRTLSDLQISVSHPSHTWISFGVLQRMNKKKGINKTIASDSILEKSLNKLFAIDGDDNASMTSRRFAVCCCMLFCTIATHVKCQTLFSLRPFHFCVNIGRTSTAHQLLTALIYQLLPTFGTFFVVIVVVRLPGCSIFFFSFGLFIYKHDLSECCVTCSLSMCTIS